MSATTILLPGQIIPLPSTSSVTLGPGAIPSTSRDGQSAYFVAEKMGVMGIKEGKRRKGKERADESSGQSVGVWVDGRSRRYIPLPSDPVLATVLGRSGQDTYRCDISASGQGPNLAMLNELSFEGASRKSAKTRMATGTLLYARVSTASRDLEPEIECLDPASGKAEGFGELKGGLIVEVGLRTCRRLLAPSSPLKHLPTIYPSLSFETAIGLNGRIWIKAKTIKQAIGLKRMLEALDGQEKFEAGSGEGMEGMGGPGEEVWEKAGFARWLRENGWLEDA